MGSSISRIAEDLNDYTEFCERLNIKTRGYGMYNHYDEIFNKMDVGSIYGFNQKLSELEKMGWDINHIKDFYNIK